MTDKAASNLERIVEEMGDTKIAHSDKGKTVDELEDRLTKQPE